MVAYALPPSLNARLLVPALAVLAGIGVAAGIATAPGATLDAAVAQSHLADLLPMAAAPVGATGRSLIALAAGGLVAALGFLAMLVPAAPRPAHRRADAHPDAPPCRPLRPSEELDGALPIAPDPPVPPAVQDIPADLDQPLSAFDPDAIPASPKAPVRAVPPLTRVAEVQVLPPLPEPQPQPTPAPRPEAKIVAFSLAAETCSPHEEPRALAPVDTGEETIGALVARLERVARQAARTRRERAAAPTSLDDTLARLRQLAAG